MSVQSSYLSNMAAAYAGMVANMALSDLFSASVETSAGVGFGFPVQRGAADGSCIVMATGATEVIGFTVRDQSATEDLFAENDSALLIRQGPLWVTVADSGGVAPGDPVWVDLTDGSLSNADVGSSNGLRLPGCTWETTAADGELAQIQVNLGAVAIAGA